MSVEVCPVGIRCKMSCRYCYELSARRACHNAAAGSVDHDKLQAELKKVCKRGSGFSLHGGEALLASLEDLEKLWAYGFEKYGHNGIQTSGADLDEARYALIRKYNVHVGFSVDGEGELNDARRRGGPEDTRAATARTNEWIRRCLRDGVGCSVIATLSRENASAERLPHLLEWWRGLSRAGLRYARLHMMERDDPAGEELALTPDESVAAFLAHHELEAELNRTHWWHRRPAWWRAVWHALQRRPQRARGLTFDLFKDIEAKLRDPHHGVTCLFEWCDPLVTPSVIGFEADGARAGCGRESKDGRRWEPLRPHRPFRQAALWHTPRAEGGCAGCRFFIICGGNCPGTAIDGDWRKRSQDCEVWTRLFEHIEAEMVARGEVPASKLPAAALAHMVSERLVGRWTQKSKYPVGHTDYNDARHCNE